MLYSVSEGYRTFLRYPSSRLESYQPYSYLCLMPIGIFSFQFKYNGITSVTSLSKHNAYRHFFRWITTQPKRISAFHSLKHKLQHKPNVQRHFILRKTGNQRQNGWFCKLEVTKTAIQRTFYLNIKIVSLH